MQINFQAGVEAVYDAVVAKGITPASTSLSDVVQGIMDIPGATVHTATYTASTSSSALDMGENHNYRYVNTSALTKVSGTKSITANGSSIDVKSYQYANVAVPIKTMSNVSSTAFTGKKVSCKVGDIVVGGSPNGDSSMVSGATVLRGYTLSGVYLFVLRATSTTVQAWGYGDAYLSRLYL